MRVLLWYCPEIVVGWWVEETWLTGGGSREHGLICRLPLL